MGSISLSLAEYKQESVPLELFKRTDRCSVNVLSWTALCLFPLVKWGIMDDAILVPALTGMNQSITSLL